MHFNLTPLVLRGELDNTTRGITKLTLWMSDLDTPLVLELEGDCLQDLTGSSILFRLPPPEAKELEELPPNLSRKLLQEICTESYFPLGDATLISRDLNDFHSYNKLSLEFFISNKTYYKIEASPDLLEQGPHLWENTESQTQAQLMLNKMAMQDYLRYQTHAYRSPGLVHAGKGFPFCDWDFILNRAEVLMGFVGFVCQKYADSPRPDLDVAFALGLTSYLDRLVASEDLSPGKVDYNKKKWSALDLLTNEEQRFVRFAMDNPLYSAFGKIADIMSNHLMPVDELHPDEEEVEQLVEHYVGILSNALATILLTCGDEFPASDVTKRITFIIRHLRENKKRTACLSTPVKRLLSQATDEAIRDLSDYARLLDH